MLSWLIKELLESTEDENENDQKSTKILNQIAGQNLFIPNRNETKRNELN